MSANQLLNIKEKRDAFYDAKCGLSMKDQETIDGIVNELISAVKGRCPTAQFSKDSALELLANLGMFLNQKAG